MLDPVLFQHLQCGHAIITPNNRLSTDWLEGYFLSLGQTACLKPHCLPYNTFVNQLFKQIQFLTPSTQHPIVLNDHQWHFLWQKLLEDNGIFPSQGLIQEMNSAWNKLIQWQIDINHPSFQYSPQTQLFQSLVKTMRKNLQRTQAISAPELGQYLLPYLERLPAQTYVWACFDDLTPLQVALQSALVNGVHERYEPSSVGWALAQQSPMLGQGSTYIKLYEAPDNNDECEQLCLWLTQQLANGLQKIGVVIPDLTQGQSTLTRTLSHTFKDKINLSLGIALEKYPLISHAITLLGLNKETFSKEDMALLLQTPYILNAHDSLLKRARFLQKESLTKEAKIPASLFLHALQKDHLDLHDALISLEPYPECASAHVWGLRFKQRLISLGFPGPYGMASENYQCYQRLLRLIDELASLDVISPPLSRQQAINHLKQMAKSTLFQPKNEKKQIQILGLLEAQGIHFEALWVMGLTNHTLPSRGKPSAFLPLPLQREFNMPHASQDREIKLAYTTLSRLSKASPQTVLSYAKLDNDIPHMPSPMLDINLQPFIPLKAKPPQLPQKESFNDSFKLPVLAPETIKGGSSILANQAKCPFKAFAAHRLSAYAPPTQDIGIDALTRGQILHKTMECFWQAVQSQQTLLSLDNHTQQLHIDNAIAKALKSWQQEKPETFNLISLDVEKTRLTRLVEELITFEKQRPAFQINALEKSFQLTIEGLSFNLRVDRLDIDEQQNKWVIDYKTQVPQRKPWHDERPEEPQLLMYALLDNDINTLLFLALNKGHITLSGFSENQTDIKGIQAKKDNIPWVTYQKNWQDTLSTLAKEFLDGHCETQPNRDSLCQNCDFNQLCLGAKID